MHSKTPFRRAAAVCGVAGIVAAAGLGISAPAFADVDYVYTFVADDAIEQLRFATASSTDASLDYLPEESEFFYANGVEQVGGQGYAIGDSPDGWQVATWNVESGAVESAVDIDWSDPAFNPADTDVIFNEFYSLDVAPDGTLLALAGFEVTPIVFSEPVGVSDEIRALDIGWEGTIDIAFLVSVDPDSGVIAPVADLTDYVFDNEFYVDGVATDPLTDTTYIFADDFADDVATAMFASIVDLETGDVGAPVELGGFDVAEFGYFGDADFDLDGELWAWTYLFIDFETPDTAFLVNFPAEFDPALTEVAPIGVVDPALVEIYSIATPEAEPELAATGAEAAAPLAAATGAALLGAALLFFSRRRPAKV